VGVLAGAGTTPAARALAHQASNGPAPPAVFLRALPRRALRQLAPSPGPGGAHQIDRRSIGFAGEDGE
jgi:hypothetical protein